MIATQRLYCRPYRRGLATIWALIVIAAVTTATAVAVAQFAAARRQTEMYRNRIEADWLARAGCELAAGRLLTDPEGYTGETASPIPGSKVKIVVHKDGKDKNIYRVESEARYPDNERNLVLRTERRALKRIEEGQGVRIESAPVAE
jgi:hypothetical protein